GGGAAQPLYETFTPITFEPAASELALTVAKSSYGKAATATVAVTAEGATPTGEVEVRKGNRVLGTGTLTDGTATVRLPARLKAGAHALTAHYVGDANVAAASGTATLRVTKAASRVVAK